MPPCAGRGYIHLRGGGRNIDEKKSWIFCSKIVCAQKCELANGDALTPDVNKEISVLISKTCFFSLLLLPHNFEKWTQITFLRHKTVYNEAATKCHAKK